MTNESSRIPLFQVRLGHLPVDPSQLSSLRRRPPFSHLSPFLCSSPGIPGLVNQVCFLELSFKLGSNLVITQIPLKLGYHLASVQ